MIIKLSDWLISTLRLYTYPAPVCRLGGSFDQYVRLVNIRREQSRNAIIITWLFTHLWNVRLDAYPITALFRFDGDGLIGGLNIVIPSSYKWDEVALVEEIQLINAV